MEHKNIEKAFSLVELMISLIVISLITAAFTPVVTKKLASSAISIGSGKSFSAIRSDCEKFEGYGGKCNACFDDFCLLCDIYCTQNQYKNVGECKCENCSERSEGCIKCSSAGCDECQTGYYLENGVCTRCPVGSKCNGVKRELCPKGFYQDEVLKGDCKPCFTDDGKYAPIEGSTYCSTCAAGQYTIDAKGDWSWDGNSHYGVACATCPVGWSCPDGKRPSACANNKYQDATGQTACKDCPSGKYSPNSANDKCYDCTSPCKTCSDYATNCTSCKDGYYLLGNVCKKCPTGATCNGSSYWYCTEGDNYFVKDEANATCTRYKCQGGSKYYLNGQSCLNCPANATCDGTSGWWCTDSTHFTKDVSNNTCVRTSCTADGSQYLSGQECKSCPANASCNGTSSWGCNANFAWSASSNSCVRTKCDSGYYLSGQSCIQCPANATCPGSDYWYCNSGYKLNDTSTGCVVACSCINGSCLNGASVCNSCEAGYYLDNGTCVWCPAGYGCPGGTAPKQACTGSSYSTGGFAQCNDDTNRTVWHQYYYGICTSVDHTKRDVCLGCLDNYWWDGWSCNGK